MYDWANSVYTLVIATAIFPIYYKGVAVEANGSDMVNFLGFTLQNSVLYSYALSFSFLVVATMLPLLSGAADYIGNKKIFMKCFVWLGSAGCIGLFFFSDITMLGWGIFCSIIASIGYSGSLVFYDAFLPEIVTEDRYDVTSARGYSMGYYGSVLLMVICLVLIMNPLALTSTKRKHWPPKRRSSWWGFGGSVFHRSRSASCPTIHSTRTPPEISGQKGMKKYVVCGEAWNTNRN